MKRLRLVTSSLVIGVTFFAAPAVARDATCGKRPKDLKFQIEFPGKHNRQINRIQRAATQGTTWLAKYKFEYLAGGGCVEEGWTSVDVTEQSGDYWHISDFITSPENCGPGSFGGLVALEGSQSLWCGACPDPGSPVLCGYAVLPGYGNAWDVAWCTRNCLAVDTNVVVDALVAWDSEPGYDATTLEVDNCDETWVEIGGGVGVWDGIGGGFVSTPIDNGLHAGQLRVRFHFVSDGGWSDEDGLWDTDGAFLVDSLSVSDASGVVLAVEDFEGEASGDTASNDWITCNPLGYGDYAQLQPGSGILQEDACVLNSSCLWNFYKSSTYDYACNTPIPAPGQMVVPYVNERDQYISNEIWSPEIPFFGSGSVVNITFDLYRDLKLDALNFYVWHVRSVVSGCPSAWADRGFVYYGGGKDWLQAGQGVGDIIDAGASDIQISLGVVDMCGFWCGIYGTGSCHSHAPLFDNVECYRVALSGPQFSLRDIDQFQDNFPADGTITGAARIDMAQDILPNASPGVLPGDSAVIQVGDPVDGLATDPNTGWGPAVYFYARVTPQGPAKSPLAMQASDIRNGSLRWPWVGDQVDAGGNTWHQFRLDTCFTANGGLVPDRYCIDLNDNLFVPGDTIRFFYGAANTAAVTRYLQADEDHVGIWTTGSFDEAAERPDDEVQILPGAGYFRGGEILYVDGMNFRNAQWTFDSSFEAMNIDDRVDRFDIRGPSSAVGNHLGSRVVDPVAQLSNVYRLIVWNCGDLSTAFGDGTGTPDKSDDTGDMKVFLDNLPNTGGALRSGGVYLSGDDVGEMWAGYTSASALALRFYLSYTVVNTNHEAVGLGVSPWVVGATGSCFKHLGVPDTMVAHGGCPLINDFDVLAPAGAAVLEANYVSNVGLPATGGAIVSQTTANPNGALIGFVLSGFSFHFIRDYDYDSVEDRWHHLEDILRWMTVSPDPPITTGPEARRNSLAQNYPNPFNPTTTIEYTIKERAHVSLKVYNVAGQLVRTLVNGAQNPDQVKPVTWRGINNAGERVSSGVYFYRLVTRNFTQTKKMVLVK